MGCSSVWKLFEASGQFLRNWDFGLEAELCLNRFCCWTEGSFMWVWVTGDRRFYSSLERLCLELSQH